MPKVWSSTKVDSNRQHGWSWQEIAEVLGVSQAVHKKHARRRTRLGWHPPELTKETPNDV